MANPPNSMQAVEIAEPGPPDVLRIADRPVPEPGSDEVLIEVGAAGVNRPDCLQRRGLYPPPPGASDIPGLEVAGRIAATGRNVNSVTTGDLVCALLSGGGYAQYCCVPAVQCLPVPRGMSLTKAAAIPETFFTVWTNVFERGRLQPGERLLVHGGASGIGTTAIQLAAALGADVYATAGGRAKTSLCKRLGATLAIDYKHDDFSAAISNATNDEGVDVILDIVGGAYLEQNIKLLRKRGRLVVIGILGGAKGNLNLGLVISKHLTITGSTLRARTPAEKGAIAKQLYERVWPLFEEKQIEPVIQQEFEFGSAARAHSLLEGNEAAGKLVLIVNADLAGTINR
jgi:putative PIG3 family NAD(P)H quinone oxidoreductase